MTLNSFVYCATKLKSHDKFMLKCIPLTSEHISYESVERECRIQKSLSHPFIMPIEEAVEDKGFKVIVMPFAKEGTIGSIYSKEKPTSNIFSSITSMAKIMFRLLLAVDYMHKRMILHGDIKPDNIVLFGTEDDPKPQIIDFGFAQEISQSKRCKCTCLSAGYASPEQLRKQEHTFASDIYSLGATFKYMVTGENPLNKLEDYKVMANRILNINFSDINITSLRELIRAMMSPTAGKRPDATICIHSTFFTEVLGSNWIENEIHSLRPQTSVFIDSCIKYDEYNDVGN
jgi:serine/threonine protein kinase